MRDINKRRWGEGGRDAPQKRPRTCCDFERENEPVYKNFLPLTRRDLLASDRTAANSGLAKSRGTCRVALLRDLASTRVNAASDVIKQITWTDPSGI